MVEICSCAWCAIRHATCIYRCKYINMCAFHYFCGRSYIYKVCSCQAYAPDVVKHKVLHQYSDWIRQYTTYVPRLSKDTVCLYNTNLLSCLTLMVYTSSEKVYTLLYTKYVFRYMFWLFYIFTSNVKKTRPDWIVWIMYI